MKPPLFIATENSGKLREFEEFLSPRFQVYSAGQASLIRYAPLDVEETGQSYFENALKKALGYSRTFRMPVLSDDSGLEVDALGGAPGVFSARFGSVSMSWPERWQHLYGSLAGQSPTYWTARFRSILCYYDGQRVPYFFSGVAEGRISPEPRGEQGFGYDPIFFSADLGKTFGEATEEEKKRFSHRGHALRHFLAWSGLDHPRE